MPLLFIHDNEEGAAQSSGLIDDEDDEEDEEDEEDETQCLDGMTWMLNSRTMSHDGPSVGTRMHVGQVQDKMK